MIEMTSPQSSTVPFLKPSEEQAAKIRRQLEGVYKELVLVQHVLQVCGGACSADQAAIRNVDLVLRRCGADRLSSVQKTIASLIERFGGRQRESS